MDTGAEGFLATIEEFDFTFQSTVRLSLIGSALGPELISEGRTMVLCGPSGTGKTHLAIAIAYKAIQNGGTAVFREANHLIEELSEATRSGTLRQAIEPYLHADVLVIDELGYLTYPQDAANVLFQVLDQRYLQKKAIVVTTNKPLEKWATVLHDKDLAEAIIDRVLARGRLIELRGTSYRTRHLKNTKDDGAQPLAQSARVSGISGPDVPEPTAPPVGQCAVVRAPLDAAAKRVGGDQPPDIDPHRSRSINSRRSSSQRRATLAGPVTASTKGRLALAYGPRARVNGVDDAHLAISICGGMIEIILSSDPAPDLLLLRFAASGEGDGLDAVFHVDQSPIAVDYQFATDARDLLEWVAELEHLHASLAGVVVYPKHGPLQIAVSVGDRARGRLDVRASLWLEAAVRGRPPGVWYASSPHAAAFAGFVSDQSFLPLHTAALRSYLSTTGLSRRLEVVEVELGKVGSAGEMHAAFAAALGFPDFYGCNLDAFHDAITGLVVMPRTLILRGWQSLTQRLPREAAIVQQMLHDRASSARDGFTIVFA